MSTGKDLRLETHNRDSMGRVKGEEVQCGRRRSSKKLATFTNAEKVTLNQISSFFPKWVKLPRFD